MRRVQLHHAVSLGGGGARLGWQLGGGGGGGACESGLESSWFGGRGLEQVEFVLQQQQQLGCDRLQHRQRHRLPQLCGR